MAARSASGEEPSNPGGGPREAPGGQQGLSVGHPTVTATALSHGKADSGAVRSPQTAVPLRLRHPNRRAVPAAGASVGGGIPRPVAVGDGSPGDSIGSRRGLSGGTRPRPPPSPREGRGHRGRQSRCPALRSPPAPARPAASSSVSRGSRASAGLRTTLRRAGRSRAGREPGRRGHLGLAWLPTLGTHQCPRDAPLRPSTGRLLRE